MLKRRRLPALALVALLFPIAAMAQETERVQRTVPLAPGGTLRLENFSGRVTITGTSGNQVIIEAVRTATRDRLDNIKLSIETAGNTVSIQANRKNPDWDERNDNVVKTDFDIKVPMQTSLDLKVFSSPIVVHNVEGSHRFNSFSGSVNVEGVAGPIEVKTFSGEVTVALAPQAASPNLQIETFNAEIDVALPAAARAVVSFNSFSGNIDSQLPLTLQSKSRQGLRATLNGGGDGRLELKTFSGNVKLR